MVLTNHIRYVFTAFIVLLSPSAHAGIMDFVGEIQKDIRETLSIHDIKPYIIPIE